ncbi:MAG: hypothetical protein IT320_08330 [Anaerolineae bacterium]|nr:hypothetical protein [Anaerolineae bacterium]
MAAVLIGLLNISLMIYVAVTPLEQRYFAENPLPLTITWLVFIMMTFLQYAVIPAVANWVRDVDRDWTRFGSILGIVAMLTGSYWRPAASGGRPARWPDRRR